MARQLILSSLVLIFGLMMTACGAKTTDDTSTGSNDPGGGGTTPKAVLSSWSAITGQTLVLDLTAGNLNSTTFSATVTYMGSICTYLLQLGVHDTAGDCVVTAAPTFSGVTTGFSSANCTTNVFNICGIGAASGSGEYDWDGNGLSFPLNSTQYR